VTEQSERYDRIAVGYARWWAPVLAPAVAELIDEIEPRSAGWRRILDVGTGTGQLALLALRRWPSSSVTGIDASAGMLSIAGAQADDHLGPGERHRFDAVTAVADALPFDDEAFDAALSSFVLQLVPSRARVLRETRRVLRPGGWLAYVSWLDDDRQFLPDRIYDETIDELQLEPRGEDGRSGDIPSVDRASGELRRAGFADVTARRGWLEHRFTIDGYLSFLIEFDEESFIAGLEPDVRGRLLDLVRGRLQRLTDDEMTMRFPIVFAAGRRSR
jgi:SAM-dependent methyltransferase